MLPAIAGGAGFLVFVAFLAALAARRRARRDRDSLATALAEGRISVADLGREADRRRAALQEAAWAARASVTRSKHLTTALGESLANADDAEALLDELGDGLRRAREELDDSVRRADEHATEVARLEGELARNRISVEALEASSAAAETDLEEVRSAHADLEARLEEAMATSTAHAEDSARDRAEIARLTESLHLAESELESLRMSHVRATEEPDAEAETEIVLSRRVADLTAERARLEAEIERLQRDLERAREVVDRLTSEIAGMRKRADRSVATSARDGERQSEQMNARLTAREAELAELEARLSALTAAREADLARLTSRISQLEPLYVEVERRNERISGLEDELKDSAEALELLREEASRLERELSTAAARSNELETGLARVQATEDELREARARIEELEAGTNAVSAAEILSIRTALSVERERSARLMRRHDPAATTRAIERAVSAAVGPLKDEVARLRAGGAAPPITDDVQLIKGIGPAIAVILSELGITSLRQIAVLSAEQIDEIRPLLPAFPGRIERDRWVEQATELAERLPG